MTTDHAIETDDGWMCTTCGGGITGYPHDGGRHLPAEPGDEESVNLTPGVVWTESQLVVLRDLTVRLFKAERAVQRVRELHPEHDR